MKFRKVNVFILVHNLFLNYRVACFCELKNNIIASVRTYKNSNIAFSENRQSGNKIGPTRLLVVNAVRVFVSVI
jgi:hypothetical protein